MVEELTLLRPNMAAGHKPHIAETARASAAAGAAALVVTHVPVYWLEELSRYPKLPALLFAASSPLRNTELWAKQCSGWPPPGRG